MSTSPPGPSGIRDGRQVAGLRVPSLLALMVAVVAAVAAVAYWDEERESSAALADFAGEQSTVARGAAAALEAGLRASADARGQGAAETVGPDGNAVPAALVGGLGVLERAGAVRVLVLPPSAGALRDLRGTPVDSPPIVAALRSDAPAVRLSREEAAAVGLPARTAVAGLSRVEPRAGERWGVAVVANAWRLRDRERRARWRLVLATVVAGGLVLGFGGMVLRRQRKELELERELAVAQVQSGLDERLQRADRAATLGTFAMGIAHEISTPLGVITGRAEQLLPAVRDDERASAAVRTILEQGGRIHQVIRAFLALARGDAAPASDLDPGELARSALALCEHRFERAGVALEADVPAGVPAVRGDARLLEQALVNLLLNACDACERGGKVSLHVSGRAPVRFEVADDGTGIGGADAARVMEPFFTTKPSGGGLGLAIVSEIAKHHRGSLSFAPREPRGTLARLDVPAAEEGGG